MNYSAEHLFQGKDLVQNCLLNKVSLLGNSGRGNYVTATHFILNQQNCYGPSRLVLYEQISYLICWFDTVSKVLRLNQRNLLCTDQPAACQSMFKHIKFKTILIVNSTQQLNNIYLYLIRGCVPKESAKSLPWGGECSE